MRKQRTSFSSIFPIPKFIIIFINTHLLHSNMIKQNAPKGYVVSTAGFNEIARSYAQGLNIDLIDGTELVEM